MTWVIIGSLTMVVIGIIKGAAPYKGDYDYVFNRGWF